MTGRERLAAASRGGEVDRKPVLRWQSGLGAGPLADSVSDGFVATTPEEALEVMKQRPDAAVILTVLSPLGHELKTPRNLLGLLHDSPEEGEALLMECAEKTRGALSQAMDLGLDGIAYILAGASPSVTTPMQYGGHFLELDREILDSVREARFNLLWVRGDSEPYLDFVIDLPAHAFAWDMARTGIPPQAMREARGGAIAGGHPDADILLVDELIDSSSQLGVFAAPEALI
jgi:hypothetical protein